MDDSQKTLMVVLPLALFVIFIILYLQFRSVITASLVFSGIVIAWAGGFILLWLYGQPWFLDFTVFGTTYLDQSFFKHRITSNVEARRATLAAGVRRVRPCLMTTPARHPRPAFRRARGGMTRASASLGIRGSDGR